MNVGDLRAILKDVPAEYEVILSKDGEGNSYSPLSGHDVEYRYEADSTWSGELVHKEDCDEDQIVTCDHEDCRYAQAIPALVLWPVN